MKKLKPRKGYRLENCPICGLMSYDYCSYSDGVWGVVEQHGFCRRCGYCAPCTVGIDIPSNFLIVNYLRKYDLADWAKTRYEGLAHHAGECIECGVCESRCPYELPIRKMLKDVAAQFGY